MTKDTSIRVPFDDDPGSGIGSAELFRTERGSTFEDSHSATGVSSEIAYESKGGQERADNSLPSLPFPPAPMRSFSAEARKTINRAFTRGISPEEKKALIEERNMLVKKKFDLVLSKKEELRLTYVRWQLDRIDDSEYGEALDIFEKVTDEYERFASDINSLVSDLHSVTGGRKPRKK